MLSLPVGVRLFEARTETVREVQRTLPVTRSIRTTHDADTQSIERMTDTLRH